MKRKKSLRITINDYICFNRKLLREEELEKNGGKWVAKDRPHRNKKKYDRNIVKKETSKRYFYND